MNTDRKEHTMTPGTRVSYLGTLYVVDHVAPLTGRVTARMFSNPRVVRTFPVRMWKVVR